MDHSNVKPSGSRKVSFKIRNTTYCCVPQCRNYAGRNISVHKFPQDTRLKSEWEAKLKMGKPSSTSMRVCSGHFLPSDFFPGADKKTRRLFPKVVPSVNLPERTHDKKDTSPQKREKAARTRRATQRKQLIDKQIFDSNSNAVSDNDTAGQSPPPSPAVTKFMCEASTQENLSDDRPVIPLNEEGFSIADMLCDGTLDKATQVNLNVKDRGRPTAASKPVNTTITLGDLLDTNEKLYTFTGIHSLEFLDGLVDCVSDLAVNPSTNQKILPLKDRIIVTMVKLKLNIGFSALGVLYNGLSRQTVSNYFKNMCPLLSRVLRVMIPWPDQSIIRQNLPLSFKNYRDTRIILDCLEIKIEQCKCLKCRVLTYSNYKKGHTTKVEVGITPSGLFTEVSPPYGGRASDKFIVNDSGILERLDYRDAVMVDKGYRIDKECLERNLTLHRPPFRVKKQQMSREDALKTAQIARARVHVERGIQRLREFKYLKGPIPWRLAAYTEDAIIIAAGLTNFGPPIIKIHRFM